MISEKCHLPIEYDQEMLQSPTIDYLTPQERDAHHHCKVSLFHTDHEPRELSRIDRY